LSAAEACAAEAEAFGFDWIVVCSRDVSCCTSATVVGSPEVKAVDARRVERVLTSSVEAISDDPLAMSDCACVIARLPSVCAAFDEIDTLLLSNDVTAAVIADWVVEKICFAEEAFCSRAEDAWAEEACADEACCCVAEEACCCTAEEACAEDATCCTAEEACCSTAEEAACCTAEDAACCVAEEACCCVAEEACCCVAEEACCCVAEEACCCVAEEAACSTADEASC